MLAVDWPLGHARATGPKGACASQHGLISLGKRACFLPKPFGGVLAQGNQPVLEGQSSPYPVRLCVPCEKTRLSESPSTPKRNQQRGAPRQGPSCGRAFRRSRFWG